MSIRQIYGMGRFCLPQPIRERFGLTEGGLLSFSPKPGPGGAIVAEALATGCAICGPADPATLRPFHGRRVCTECLDELRQFGRA